MDVDHSWSRPQQATVVVGHERREPRPRPGESLCEYIDRTIIGVVPRVGFAELGAPHLTYLDCSYVWAPYVPGFILPRAIRP